MIHHCQGQIQQGNTGDTIKFYRPIYLLLVSFNWSETLEYVLKVTFKMYSLDMKTLQLIILLLVGFSCLDYNSGQHLEPLEIFLLKYTLL